MNKDFFSKGVDSSAKCAYFIGHALGLQPKTAQEMMRVQLEKWAKR